MTLRSCSQIAVVRNSKNALYMSKAKLYKAKLQDQAAAFKALSHLYITTSSQWYQPVSFHTFLRKSIHLVHYVVYGFMLMIFHILYIQIFSENLSERRYFLPIVEGFL